jgi:hypothetical protein
MLNFSRRRKSERDICNAGPVSAAMSVQRKRQVENKIKML